MMMMMINLRTPGSFVEFCCLLVAVTKYHNKFEGLRKVNSPNSQVTNIMYQHVFGTICSKFMVFGLFFMNFSRKDFADLHEICGSATA